MKRFIKTALITSLVMIVLGVAGVIVLTYASRSSQQQARNEQLRELDFANSENEKEEIEEHTVKAISAESGNLKQMKHEDINTVYTVSHSSKVMKQINKWKKREKYTFDNPLFVDNPFGTNTLGLYIYYETRKKSYLSYTIQVEDEAVPNFNRSAYEDTADYMDLTHEHQIIGLVPGKVNYILLKDCSKNGKVNASAIYKVDLTGHSLSKAAVLPNEGINDSHLPKRGLFTVADKKYIYFYDNSGILRAAIPTGEKHSSHMEELEKEVLLSYGNGKYALISGIGKVTKSIKLSSKYIDEQEYTYNGYGQIWLIASETKGNTKKDQIVSLDLNTGKTKHLIDMKKIWKKVYQKKKNKNWIGLDSIALSGSSDIIVSSRKFSSLIKLSGITGYTPKIEYIISEDKTLSSISSIKKKFLKKASYEEGAWSEKEGDFAGLYQPRSLTKVDEYSLTEGQYYITLYNKSKDSAKTAKFYQLLVDENAGNYGLAAKGDLDYSENGGSVQILNENRIAFSNTEKRLSEYDETGYRIQSLDLSKLAVGDLSECRKFTMDKIWFQ